MDSSLLIQHFTPSGSRWEGPAIWSKPRLRSFCWNQCAHKSAPLYSSECVVPTSAFTPFPSWKSNSALLSTEAQSSSSYYWEFFQFQSFFNFFILFIFSPFHKRSVDIWYLTALFTPLRIVVLCSGVPHTAGTWPSATEALWLRAWRASRRAFTSRPFCIWSSYC